MTDTARKQRTPPKRIPPIRTVAPAAPTKSAVAKPAGVSEVATESSLDEAVSDAFAHAVRLGYQALAQNLEEGRLAAKQFRAGDYSVTNVPSDLNQLAKRTVRLARDLSTTTFDLLDRALQDPALVAAFRRLIAEQPASAKPKTAAAKPANAATEPSTAAPVPAIPDPQAPHLVPITCNFSGGPKAAMLPSWLIRPSPPTTLATTGLTSLNGGAPAISAITFGPSVDGVGVVADIAIPDKQPAGDYSGVVVSADSGIAFGALNIRVGP
jgi:hypothetical protein